MPKPRGKVEFYDAPAWDDIKRRKKWYWRIEAGNSRIVAIGGEGYSSQAKARQGFAAAIKIANEFQAAERKRKPRTIYTAGGGYVSKPSDKKPINRKSKRARART